MDMCGDNRFELIEKAKQKLISETNIESHPEEMDVLDSILFRCWQMGWLDSYDDSKKVVNEKKLDELAYEHIKFDYGVDWCEDKECSFEEMCDINYEDEMYSYKAGYRKAKKD